MRALVLAAGRGRNLAPLTSNRPKPMIQICGKPILARLFRYLRQAGISDVELVVGHGRREIENYFSYGEKYDLTLRYEVQQEARGIGDALLHVREYFEPNEYFLLSYGDILFITNLFQSLINSFAVRKSAIAAVCLPPNTEKFGNIYMDDSMRISRIWEKPQAEKLGNYVLAGAFILPGRFLNLLAEMDGNLVETFHAFMKREPLIASIWENEWVDIGYPWDILTANRMIMDSWDHAEIAADIVRDGTVQITGSAHICPGVHIMHGAVIQGPCYIGEGSFIGTNALVRRYTSIGRNSMIGFGVELKDSVLFDEVRIGRLSFVGDSIIGRRVDIGAGTMTVNATSERRNIVVEIGDRTIETGLSKLGAIVGDQTVIGAGNTIRPGTRIDAKVCIDHNYSTLHPRTSGPEEV